MHENTAFQLFPTEMGGLAWCGGLRSSSYFHRTVELIYDPNHASRPIRVFVLEPKLPRVNNHIHPDSSICYQMSSEWRPDWTALTVYLKTVQFLDEFYSGRMD